MRFLKLVCMTLVLLLLASCGGPFVRLDKPDYTDAERGYSVKLPVGWVRITVPQYSDSMMISRDGYTLQSIRIEALKYDKAFETSKKLVKADAVISDVAELEIAEIKAKSSNAASIKILENSLKTISAQQAYKVHLSYLNEKGLRFEQITYGLVGTQYYYRLTYQAPKLHYFERDKPAFEQAVASFVLKK